MAMFSVRIRGVDRVTRNLANTSDDTFDAAREGCNAAAKYLLEKIKAKFGTYQSTGGAPKGQGSWPKLKPETRWKKMKKYGYADKPLIATGKAVSSLKLKEGGKGRLAASVSTEGYMVHHVYGAPGANVPMRDPMRVTALEEQNACRDIVNDYIQKALRRSGL